MTFPTICLKPTKVCSLMQVLKKMKVSSKIETGDGEIFEESCCCISEHFKLLSLEITSLTSYSSWRVSFIHQTESRGSVKKEKWLPIMFNTASSVIAPRSNLLPELPLSLLKTFHRNTELLRRFFYFIKAAFLRPPPSPVFSILRELVCCGMKALSNMQVFFSSVVSNCVKTMLVCVGGVRGTAFPFV